MNLTDAELFLISRGKLPELNDKARQEFHWAIEEGTLDEVKAWLAIGMSVDTKHDNSFPIIRAAEGDSAEMISFLVDLGADLNVRDDDGDTALHTAVNWNAENAFKMLIEKKSPIDTSNDTGIASFSSTPYSNANESYKEIAKQILTFETTTQLDIFGKDDPVAFAKQVDAYRLQLWIIKDLNFAKKLITAGAGKGESETFSPLLTAVESEDIDLLKLLINEGYSPNGLSLFKESILQVACRQGNVETVMILLDAGANLEYIFPDFGSGTLCNAVESGNIELVELLLKRGANANIMKAGWTPLFRAASNGNLKMVKLLLEAGASKDTKTRANQSAAEIAIENEHEEIASLLK